MLDANFILEFTTALELELSIQRLRPYAVCSHALFETEADGELVFPAS